jgi:hypothetical protein
MKSKDLPVVRALGQFGPMPKDPQTLKLFLDDARNPPLKEKGWVVVRTVESARAFCRQYGERITELSLDNDLGPDPQGIDFLKWVMIVGMANYLPNLTTVTVHTGNLPKWRKMMALLRMTDLKAIRRVPHDRIYPRASEDTRKIKEWVA